MLQKYSEKRDFEKTPEPAPAEAPAAGGPLIFVVQKHAATRLHYDFRLEVDGVLKSWPIPKGPSLDPLDKRLAVMVEDHPLDYASFEGVIPRGEYGAGQVIVWDAGTYSPDEDGRLSWGDREEANRRMREGIEKGKVSVFLRGRKLKGSWTLVKTRQGANDWLLIKHKDAFADPGRDIVEENRSVISGLTIADLRAGRPPGSRTRGRLLLRPRDLEGAAAAPLPKTVKPMLASLVERPFSSPEWVFEPKLDGVRALAVIRDGEARLLSRRGLDTTRQYPGVCRDLKIHPDEGLVLDGEIVALDARGVPSFQRLQGRLNLQRDEDIGQAEAQIPVIYYVFDLLYANGYDLRGACLEDRKALLFQMLLPQPRVQLVHAFEQDGEDAFEAAVSLGLEGLVAKKRRSAYEAGRRSNQWLKIKAAREQEFVVAGYTGGSGARAKTFGSLLLGYYDEQGRLAYAGHVGTGFDDRMLRDLLGRLEALRTDEMPFDEPPRRGGLRFGRPKDVPLYWVRPELVAEVKFAQWTDDGLLRAPSFLGLRTDKDPREAGKEAPRPLPPEAAASSSGSTAAVGEAGRVLQQLENPADKLILRVEGHRISLNNLNKELWPEYEGQRALTKRDLLVYLARVSPYLLNHMRDRPITLTRYPNGIHGQHFYQKHWETKLPQFVDTVMLYSEQYNEDQEYLVCNNLATLLWLGQLAGIELHTWYSRISPEPDGRHLSTRFTGSFENVKRSLLNYPDFIVFDLDPYIYSGDEKPGGEPELNRKAFLRTCEAAFWLKDLLDSLSLSSFVKTSGKTGLHVYVPILRQFDYETVRGFAETIGKFLMSQHPRDITMEWSVPKRKGKIFFDHNQNSRGKTLASVYSPRPRPHASVSMPVRWDELRDVYPADYTILTACGRIEKTGDLWANILDEKHDLAGILGVLEE
jgi:bifunctional non-homologous end joining protein LigD